MPNSGKPASDADWDALARYVTGESPRAEAEAVRAWLAADPERQEMLDLLVRSMAALEHRPPADLDVESALRSAKARLEAEAGVALAGVAAGVPGIGDVGEGPAVFAGAGAAPVRGGAGRERVAGAWFRNRGGSRGWGAFALRAAAVVALVVAGVVLWHSVEWTGDRPHTVAGAQTFRTSVGERDSVWLPDGSRVLLGPSSRLTLRPGYGGSRRELEMVGAAYFDVEPDDGRPFVVRVGGAEVRVVGTSFAVRGGGEEEVRVVVEEGAVRLRSAAEPEGGGVLLEAGDRGMLDAEGRTLAERGAATEEDYAWRHGRLVFRDAPLDRVSAELMRWYGVKVRFEDPALEARRLTADFAGDPVREVMDVIALALGAEVAWMGDTAVVRPRVDEAPPH